MIAAIGGVNFVSEFFSQRLVISTALTLKGILMVILGRRKPGDIGIIRKPDQGEKRTLPAPDRTVVSRFHRRGISGRFSSTRPFLMGEPMTYTVTS